MAKTGAEAESSKATFKRREGNEGVMAERGLHGPSKLVKEEKKREGTSKATDATRSFMYRALACSTGVLLFREGMVRTRGASLSCCCMHFCLHDERCFPI